MLVRQFSPHGGLELYAHKVVEGLLQKGVSVTVICQENLSELQDENLHFKLFAGEAKASGKAAKFRALYKEASSAIAGLNDVDLVHSQHCPCDGADVVTFHNHSTRRLSEVGLSWEKALNDLKRNFIPAYQIRAEQDKVLLQKALCLIFPAEVMKEDFYEAYPFLQAPPPKPYVVAHPGASMASDLEKLDAKNKTIGSTEGGFKFLFVGRGFRKKGLDILLEACTILNKQYPGKFKLLIAGLKKKGLDSLRLNAMGLQDCVQYLGFQKDMDAVYAQASVTILPSRVEPFGMAPIQGMQRGLVPIVSKISGVAETLHDGENALILQNHLSASELAQHMQKLMTDRESLTKLSANALKTAQKLSWDATVESTVQAYEIALSLKKSGKASVSN